MSFRLWINQSTLFIRL